ncbi:phosphatidylcholine synthase [Motilibacter peucedani]|uniref:Phosphatidylcholine synthase n=1 Tax=Motilibacter peucedani TaxID=598650 RepID=A0A420XKW4_9ACTN|nr:CDP-alcohol phosphatidyltransferase family protein [Motilibacter peucedani]RKS68555.1 phosphatidylcholine synthase [Motilibacter peucedani]
MAPSGSRTTAQESDIETQKTTPRTSYSVRERLAAWAVHAFTASGAAVGLLMVLAAIDGHVVRALWLALLALVIDGTDGTLARAVRVKEVVPEFDGARLDDIVDYLTYAFAPIVLLWTAGYLPSGAWGAVVAAVPLLASCYQFCRADAKTDDHLFTGFPSYWNIVAFYAVVLGLGSTTVTVVLLVCAVLVFVPIGYVYPSRTVVLQVPTLVVTAVWLVTYAVLLWQMPDPNAVVEAVSLAYLVYYVGISLYLTSLRRSQPAGAVAA